MDEPTFEIFRGVTVEDAVWVEAVLGFSNALQRLKEVAAASPGQYFLFEPRSHSTVVQIDSRKSLLRSPERKAKSA
jgi:hypothetical protein